MRKERILSQIYRLKDFWMFLAVVLLAGGIIGTGQTIYREVNTIIVRADGNEYQIFAPDWEAEAVVAGVGIALGEKDRMQITKSPGQRMRLEVVRYVPEPEPVRPMVATSRGATAYKAIYEMEATAYLPTDGDGLGITATGIRATHGVVAVDPRVIPLGSKVYVPGYGFAIAADTGGAIKGRKIDLCMESYGDAMQFGRRTVTVYLL